jgi:hypothetical protein
MRSRLVFASIIAAVLAAPAARAIEPPPADPVARETWAAERREELRRENAEWQQMSPAARETARAERKIERERAKPARGVEVRGPFPLPVDVKPAGRPAGATCPSAAPCQLKVTPPVGEVLVVTAAWSATKMQCDGVVSATPPNGAPVAPGWRCTQQFTIEGPGAGYTGYLIAK